MPVRPTTQLGDPVLRKRASEVADIADPAVQQVIDDLVDSMRADNLVGMAAPQIGEGIRVFVTEIRSTIYRKKDPGELDGVRVFVNPVIAERSQETELGREGCGSVAHAGIFADVPRSRTVRVRAADRDGNPFELEAEGLLARIIQHELDHLDGRIFLDRLDSMDSLIGKESVLAMQKKPE